MNKITTLVNVYKISDKLLGLQEFRGNSDIRI